MFEIPSKQMIGILLVIGAIGTIAAIFFVRFLANHSGVEMSAHGWGAMVVGTVVSFIIGGVLTSLLVWGRRNGFDEGAHIDWTKNPPSNQVD